MSSLVTFSPIRPEYGKFFCVSTSFTTATSSQPLITDPGNNSSIYITGLVVSAGSTNGSISIVDLATGTALNIIDPITVAANGNIAFDFAHAPIKATIGSSLSLTTSGFTASHSIILTGFIK